MLGGLGNLEKGFQGKKCTRGMFFLGSEDFPGVHLLFLEVYQVCLTSFYAPNL